VKLDGNLKPGVYTFDRISPPVEGGKNEKQGKNEIQIKGGNKNGEEYSMRKRYKMIFG